ncbi:MAG: asparaginase [Proteobacteria bacterium]|nr:asparaginase [Pseudomonadota bacterium]
MSSHSVARAAAPLAEILRGDTVESVHLGHVAVVDAAGHVLYAAGDPHAEVYTRSTLKPFQALPFARAGGPGQMGFSAAQVALLCASHSGEPMHVAGAGGILQRCGCTEADLLCGTHEPYFYEATGAFPPPPPYSPLAHNCSGKHSGMLACCVMHGWPTRDYVLPGHPLQQAIRGAVAGACGVDAGSMPEGIDGCSAPNYALPLAALARGYARLGSARADAGDADEAALGRLADAMRAHPEMVSGERRDDLALAVAGRGDWLPKAGAEGVQALAIRSRGLGVAVKVLDGNKRSIPTIIVAILDQLGLIGPEQRMALGTFGRQPLRNLRGTVTGHTRAAFALQPPGV